MNIVLLKILVGSRAYGLEREDSDYDVRGVYLSPTSEILKIDATKTDENRLLTEDLDSVFWEFSKFFKLCINGNPNVLECFFCPVIESTEIGKEILDFSPNCFDKDSIYKSYRGYSGQQRKRFLDKNEVRARKYGYTALRVLQQGCELLLTGKITPNIRDTEIFNTVMEIKDGFYLLNEIKQKIDVLDLKLDAAYEKSILGHIDMNKINDFVLRVRKENW